MSDYRDVTARLAENNIGHAELDLDGNTLVLPERGGHALGPFDREGRSCFWLTPAFTDAEAFADLVARRDWNIGGLRLWLAPEIRLGVRDRERYWETLRVQPDMEPAACGWTIADGAASTAYSLRLEVCNPNCEAVTLDLRRTIRPVRNPLRDRLSGLDYFGFNHVATSTKTNAAPVMVENWNLVQVRGGGTAFVPVTGDFVYRDYYEPLELSHRRTAPGLARLCLDGRKRFKIGIQSSCHFGRIGYWRRVGNAEELLVCNYFNDPSALYAEQPAGDPEASGLSMHVYNDGGMFGGFAELEANGRTIGGDGDGDGASRTDTFTVWGFRGTAEAVRDAAGMLLGVREWDDE